MKKLLILFAVAALILASCNSVPPKNDGGGTNDIPQLDVGPADIGSDRIEIAILSDQYSAWANWTDDERVTQGIVNPDTVSHTYPRKHLPLYKIDSVEELERFVADYGDVFSMEYKY
ncbi:MAG: membrane lipoprotein lipid attachment site-containing protein, partial [Clostridia bacterium]|nr:membrane lipoprotein lipid attachment site-containing protein [Clostridia bacterium]